MPSFACFIRLFWRTPSTLKFLNQVRPERLHGVKMAAGPIAERNQGIFSYCLFFSTVIWAKQSFKYILNNRE